MCSRDGVDNAVENKLGHGFWGQAAGKTAGALAGAGTAIGTGAAALVGDVAGGVVATGQGLWNGAKALGPLSFAFGKIERRIWRHIRGFA